MSAIERYYEYKHRLDEYLWSIKWIEKIRYKYWDLIPYDYRPHEIWYKIKCFVWHRYTTVKPRYLGHTWCDRSDLLPNMMFEILSDFIENECSPGHVEWYHSDKFHPGHKIKRAGREIWVRDEMQDLYDWWHKTYIPWSENPPEREEWYEYENKHVLTSKDNLNEWFNDRKYDSEESKKEAQRLFDVLHKKEDDMERQLKRNLHRVLNIMDYMWT